jgi:hypothetical protein
MFDNDEPEDREQLVQSLALRGLYATEYASNGRTRRVMVPLVDTRKDPPLINAEKPEVAERVQAFIASSAGPANLYLVTGSTSTNCDIGFIGEDGRGGKVEFTTWEHAGTLEEAVHIFLRLWKRRDVVLQALVDGKLSKAV